MLYYFYYDKVAVYITLLHNLFLQAITYNHRQ